MAKNGSSLVKRYVSLLGNEFRGYNASALLGDFIAGVTVGAVALPLALAFGAASVSAEHAAVGVAAGLITAIVAGIVSGLLGGGSFQISGPTVCGTRSRTHSSTALRLSENKTKIA